MTDQERPNGEELRDAARTARRLGGQAEHDAELESATAAGDGGHPRPDIAAADRVRARDDLDTYRRQEEAAEAQARAAESLERNRRTLSTAREELRELREEVAGNGDEVRRVSSGARELEGRVEEARDAVRDVDVEGGEDE
jgi:hypothetical protein